ncbi:MAG: hypothetical protein PHN49_08320 [Candidatus Omnitrophica bacterium]|nr:hypothetical protein [Candidatus Omnitrophota bacterium]MDD5671629.1 hypothetical protein [Candidatus Omnitrophota bacterium]
MIRVTNQNQKRPGKGTYRLVKAFIRALEQVEGILLRIDTVTSGEVHEVKSLLYAVIEQLGTQSDRLVTVRQMLRELFVLVSECAGLKEHERRAGLMIVADLRSRLNR